MHEPDVEFQLLAYTLSLAALVGGLVCARGALHHALNVIGLRLTRRLPYEDPQLAAAIAHPNHKAPAYLLYAVTWAAVSGVAFLAAYATAMRWWW